MNETSRKYQLIQSYICENWFIYAQLQLVNSKILSACSGKIYNAWACRWRGSCNL